MVLSIRMRTIQIWIGQIYYIREDVVYLGSEVPSMSWVKKDYTDYVTWIMLVDMDFIIIRHGFQSLSKHSKAF